MVQQKGNGSLAVSWIEGKHMQRTLFFIAIVFVIAIPADAQECNCSKVEVFGGYSFLSASPKTDRIPPSIPPLPTDFNSRISQHGYGINVAINLTSRFGFVADVSRNMADKAIASANTDTSTTLFLFGPRFSSRSEGVTYFGQALVGGARRRAESTIIKVSGNDFALAVGGGLDLHASKYIAFRIFQLDYIPTRGGDNTPGIGTRWSQNYRAQTGLVVTLGH
jgi:hypothetical protein